MEVICGATIAVFPQSLARSFLWGPDGQFLELLHNRLESKALVVILYIRPSAITV